MLERSKATVDTQGIGLKPRVAAWHAKYTDSDVDGAAAEITALLREARVNATVDPNADSATKGFSLAPASGMSAGSNEIASDSVGGDDVGYKSGLGAAPAALMLADGVVGQEGGHDKAQRRRSLLGAVAESAGIVLDSLMQRVDRALHRTLRNSVISEDRTSRQTPERPSTGLGRRLQQDWATLGSEDSGSSTESALDALQNPAVGQGAAEEISGLDRAPVAEIDDPVIPLPVSKSNADTGRGHVASGLRQDSGTEANPVSIGSGNTVNPVPDIVGSSSSSISAVAGVGAVTDGEGLRQVEGVITALQAADFDSTVETPAAERDEWHAAVAGMP